MDAFPTRRDEHIHAITVRGEIDLASAGDLLARLRTLASPVSGPILLDLSLVTFMDCAGLRTLRLFDRYVAAAGGSVHVAAVSPSVARLFELAALPEGAVQLPAPPALDAVPRPAAARQRHGAWATATV